MPEWIKDAWHTFDDICRSMDIEYSIEVDDSDLQVYSVDDDIDRDKLTTKILEIPKVKSGDIVVNIDDSERKGKLLYNFKVGIVEDQYKHPTGKHRRMQSMYPSSFKKSQTFGGISESLDSILQFKEPEILGAVGKPPSSVDNCNALKTILGFMGALYLNYWVSHWQSSGDDSYENHLLFQRLYEELIDRIDLLGEKMVGYFGNDSVDLLSIGVIGYKYVCQWSHENNLVSRAIMAEKQFQKILEDTYNELKEIGLSLGLDDYLMSVANDHETNLYLLQQRSEQ